MPITNFNQNQWQWQGQVHPDIHQTVTNRGYRHNPQGTIMQNQPTFHPQAPHTQMWRNYNQTAPSISSSTTFQRHFSDSEGTYNQPMVHSPSSRVYRMDYKETSKFILAYGLEKGWEEAYQYAANFKMHEITGEDLCELDDQILKEELGIKNENHTKCLIEIIKTATDQGKTARSADMGLNEDSTTRYEILGWV